MVACGWLPREPARELDSFLETIRTEMAQYIRNVHSDSTPATGEFEDFSIRH